MKWKIIVQWLGILPSWSVRDSVHEEPFTWMLFPNKAKKEQGKKYIIWLPWHFVIAFLRQEIGLPICTFANMTELHLNILADIHNIIKDELQPQQNGSPFHPDSIKRVTIKGPEKWSLKDSNSLELPPHLNFTHLPWETKKNLEAALLEWILLMHTRPSVLVIYLLLEKHIKKVITASMYSSISQTPLYNPLHLFLLSSSSAIIIIIITAVIIVICCCQ